MEMSRLFIRDFFPTASPQPAISFTPKYDLDRTNKPNTKTYLEVIFPNW